jgi:Enterobacterial virulence protein IpgD
MPPTIGAYREVAAGFYSQRVTLGHNNDLVKADRWDAGNRLVQWNNPTQQIQTDNRLSIDAFRQSLRTTYGQAIADRVMNQSGLTARRRAGQNLSTSAIKIALDLADQKRANTIAQNVTSLRNAMQSGGALLSKFYVVTGGKFADLTSKEKTKLQNLFIQALRNEPDFARRTLTAQVIGNVARETVESFMTNRNARLGSRAANVFARANQNVGQYGVKGYDRVHNLIAQVRTVSTDHADRLDHALEVIDKSFDLLDEGAFTTTQLNDYIGRLDQVALEVDQRRAALQTIAGDQTLPLAQRQLAGDLQQDLTDTLQRLAQRKQYSESFRDNRPVSGAAVMHSLQSWSHAGVRLLDAEIDQLDQQLQNQPVVQQNDPVLLKRQVLDNARQTIQNAIQLKGNTPPYNSVTSEIADVKPIERDHKAEVLRTVKHAFRQAGISTNTLEKNLEKQQVVALNKDFNWDPIETEIRATIGGEQRVIDSTITPAYHLGEPFTTSYDNSGVKGICSINQDQTDHAVNLAVSEIRDGTTGARIIAFVRHAVHSAYEAPANQQVQANQTRATESVQAALLTNTAVLQQAIFNAKANNGQGNGQVVDLPITSINLQTNSMISSFENTMVHQQFEAFDHINGLPHLDVDVPDPMNQGQTIRVQVRPRVLAFNFGTNPVATFGNMGIGDNTETRGRNEAGMKALFGDGLKVDDPLGGMVGAALNNPAIPGWKKTCIRELSRQIKQMWADRSYNTDDGDVYKMMARLTVLTDMIGATAMFNCKSGKDRTGHLDAEVKMLASEIFYTHTVPPYGKLSTSRKEAFSQFALHSGNHEMQRYNTGFAGYKTFNVDSNLRRLRDEVKKLYEAAADAVKH